MSEWQPIETAPETGRFMAWNPVTGTYITEPKRGYFPMHGWGDLPGTWYPSPTHWMPLPEPPK